jgi:hypothetical protein
MRAVLISADGTESVIVQDKAMPLITSPFTGRTYSLRNFVKVEDGTFAEYVEETRRDEQDRHSVDGSKLEPYSGV